METEANIVRVLEREARPDEDMATLAVELDAIPGAVWQAELQSLMPKDTRVSLFERGGQKCALLTFPTTRADSAYEAFDEALQGANAVSVEAHRAARAARRG